MWSFNFAGSIPSRTDAIGRAVGVGDGVGAAVAELATRPEGGGGEGEVEAPLHADTANASTIR
jgi:hypothetical protein